MGTYYAYVHAKPTNEGAHSIFYVGKGRLRRVNLLNRSTRNLHYTRTVKKYGSENILIGKIACSSEAIAFELERGLIKCLRASGVKLTNLTDGGEGSSGYKPTAERIAKSSAATKARWADVDYREATIKAQTAAQRKLVMSEKKRISSASNLVKGRAALATVEGKAKAAKKNSEKSLAMWANSEAKAAISLAIKASWTPEARLAKGDDVRGRKRVTNGTEERNVRPEEVGAYLLQGWREGRKPRTPSKRPRSDKNTKLFERN